MDMNATHPPYVLLGNGAVAAMFLGSVVRSGHAPQLVVLNARERQRDADPLRDAARSGAIPVEEWEEGGFERLMALSRERQDLWLLSVYFGHIVPAALLEAVGGRAVNLHASLLPWNRGVHTNVWPIVEGTPAGVTLHAMVPSVDAGPVLAQLAVEVHAWDTAATLYGRLEAAGLRLLVDAWPAVVLARWPGVPQTGGGTAHRLADFARLAEYSFDGHPEARAFFDLLRARSFPPHGGLVIRTGGARVEAVVTLKEVRDE